MNFKDLFKDDEDEKVAENESEVSIINARSFDQDAAEIADRLLKNQVVIVNMSRLDEHTLQRMLDFLYGVTCGIHGKHYETGEKNYAFVPKGRKVDFIEERESDDSSAL